MQQDQHGQLLLETIRHLGLKVGDAMPIALLFERGLGLGIEATDMEDALIHASAIGWVICTNDELHLTQMGHTILYPANDNS